MSKFVFDDDCGEELAPYTPEDGHRAKMKLIEMNGRARYEIFHADLLENGLASDGPHDDSVLDTLLELDQPKLEYRNTKLDDWFNHPELFPHEDLFEAAVTSLYPLPGFYFMSEEARTRLAKASSVLLSRSFYINRWGAEFSNEEKTILLEDLKHRMAILHLAIVRSGGFLKGPNEFPPSLTDLLKDAKEFKRLALARQSGSGDGKSRRPFNSPIDSNSIEQGTLPDVLLPKFTHNLKISPLGKGARQSAQISEKKEN